MAKTELTEEQKRAEEFVQQAAQSIISLAEGMRKVLAGKLNKRAIVLLLTAASRGVRQDQVETVIDAIASLDKTFTK